jgi:head-tail adaptor
MTSSKAPQIKDFRHRVILCSARENVTEGRLLLERSGVYEAWAAIKQVKDWQRSREGAPFQLAEPTATHKICMRYNHTVALSVGAWLFEERQLSAPRWFKIIGVDTYENRGMFWKLMCRIAEESDDASHPTAERPVPSAFEPVRQRT